MNVNDLRGDFADFLSRLGRLLTYGVPLAPALEVLEADMTLPPLKKTAAQIRQALEAGKPFSDCLQGLPVMSPPLAAALHAAEQKGQLDHGLLELAEAVRNGAFPIETAAPGLAEAAGEVPEAAVVAGSAKQMAIELFHRSIAARASDIHIDPVRGGAVVRLRIDGLLHQQPDALTRGQHEAIVSQIKQMAALDPAERQLPQDGRIRMPLDGQAGAEPAGEVDLRVSVCPYVLGEKVVVRILNASYLPHDLDEIMPPEHVATVRRWLQSPYGLILTSGPTGSGKTTTLLVMLNEIARSQAVNVVSVEDPVEVVIPGVQQMQIRPAIGLTLPAALRSLLRQDPDVILVGELEQPEAAKLAIDAAHTGHLVLSQVHSHDTVAAVRLLVDMDIPIFMLREMFRGIISQRLVRRLCPDCKQELTADDRERAPEHYRPIDGPLFKPVGCDQCGQIGFRGWLALYELFEPAPQFWNSLAEGMSDGQLRAQSTDQRHTLRDDGIKVLSQGTTSWQEIERVLVL